ncbi:DUF1893 domain-containing protein [candidate division KSB1 bacterium]|nr:DUF1893 domain-containing protein [candidate division KSB1 bacterium]
MADWQNKLHHLKQNNLSIHIEKEGKTIFESHDPMLKPLFVCLLEKRDELVGATVVDKIVGRAAALLMTLGRVKEVFTPLASETAKHVLDAAEISLQAENIIPYIINRDNTGMCPMEKMANECETAEEFFAKLKGMIEQ